jgi:RNA-directed DNA polymerase
MLAALERGMKGNRWFSLIDKVYADRTLELAWDKVRSNAGGSGVDGMTIERFAQSCPRGLLDLKEQLRQASYQPKPVKRVWIPKPGTNQKRPLGIPTVRDRIVQTALRMVIEPIFEHRFAEHSYGFRPGRGCKDALRRVQALLDEGHTWVVDADLKSYFDTIPKDRLIGRVEERIADGRVMALIQSYLDQGVMEELRLHEPSERGTPQGAVISPLLANLYLDPLDHLMAASGTQMVRYADDCDPVPKSGGGAGHLGPGESLGGGKRPDASSGEDARNRCGTSRRLRLPGLPLREVIPVAAPQGAGRIEGQGSGAYAPHQRRLLGVHRRAA